MKWNETNYYVEDVDDGGCVTRHTTYSDALKDYQYRVDKRVYEMSKLSDIGPTTRGVLADVGNERRRQDEKWGVQNHFPTTWLAILGEEFGELSEAIVETIFYNGMAARQRGGFVNIRREAIHVAAVAVAMVEYLDRQKDAPAESGNEDSA
jgi:hypothetical protein